MAAPLALLIPAGKALIGGLMKKAAFAAVKKGAVSAIKKRVVSSAKKRAIGAAKNFVTGKGKKRKGKKGVASKGGALVRSVGGGLSKTGSVGSSFIPKGGALVKSPSGSLSITGGDSATSFEAMSTTLDSIVGLTSQIEKIAESQYKNRKAANQEARKEKDKEKKKNREEQLESKNKKPGSGLLGKVAETAKGFNLGGFLMNILMGGIALALWKSWDKIKGLFDFLGKKITSFWDMMRYGVIALTTAFRKPTKWIVDTAGKILKKTGNLIKKAWKSLDDLLGGGLTKLADGIKNWGKSLWKKVTEIATGGAKQGANAATRATGVGKRGFKGKGANNIVPGPKNLSKVKPNPKSFTQNITKSTGTKFQKSGLKRLSKVSKVFKRIPVIGALLGIGIDLALGERLDNAIFGALGASLGAWIGGGVGSLILPFAGTLAGAIVGGMVGDWLGKELYKTMSGQISGLASEGPQEGDVRYNEKGEREVYSAEKNKWVSTSTTTTTTGDADVSSNISLTNTDYMNLMIETMDKGGITDRNERIMFMAQVGHESGDGRWLKEIWGPTAAQAGYEGRSDLGNTQAGDGKRFMGRGYIQITGRANYAKYGPMIGVPDATENPEKLEEPQNAAKVALAYWKNRVNREAAKKGLDGMRTVTRNINGGLNGLNDRISKFNKYSKMPLGGGQGDLSSAPTDVSIPAQVTPVGPTTTSQNLKVGDMVSGFPLSSPYGPRQMKHSDFHAGIDIGTPVGTYVGFTEDAEILYCGLYRGYGYLIDAWLPNARIQLRLAHLSEILVNKGDKIPAKTSVGRTGGAEGHPGSGTSTGPHLHLEADSVRGRAGNRGNGYGGEFDPSPYVKYIILSRTGGRGSQVTPSGQTTAVSTSQTPEVGPGPGSQQSAQQSAQIQPGSSAATPGQTASSVSSQASYERGGPGGNVVVALPGGGQVQGKVVSGGRQGGGRLIVDPGGILNSYYKAQLLGFLYKQG